MSYFYDRWWRLKLKHCRYHRQRRNQACIKMQCTIRTYVAKRRRLHLLHARYCQHIQSRLLRRCLRKRFQIWIWRRHAAVLSFHFKKYLLKKRRFEQLRRKAAIKLQRFIRRCHRKKLWINYRKLVFVFYHYKRWLNRKVRVIAGVIKLWFGRRVRYIKLIQASVRQYFVKLKLHRAYLKIKLKQLASEAKVRLGHVLTLKKERQYMCAEEKASAELRHLPIFTPPLPPPEVDEIAIQEVVQEAVIVVEEKEITPSLPPGISESSLADAKEVTLFPEDKRTAKKLPRSNQEATFAPASSNCSLAEDKVDVAVKQAPEILTFEEFLARPLEDNRGIPLPKERPGKHTRPSANALTGSWDEDAIQKSSMLHASRFLRNGVAADHHEIPIPPGQQHLGNNTNGMQKISRPYHPTSIDHSAAEFQSPQSPRAAAAVLHFDYNVNNHNTVENQGRHDNTVYSAQSLHEVLRERQAMFHLRQNQQQLHLHPSSGLDDFFTSTLAQPSPSPILSPFYQPADAFYSNAAGSRGVRPTTSQASISGATGLLGSKSRPTSASSTSAPSKLKHSNTSSTTHTSSNHSVGGMTLNTNAIYNSGSGVIASPRATKKERPKSAGTGRSKKDKENEKKKKDHISAIYLYK